jgi:geranylgeranyl pyrophosphate synthase
MIERQSAETLDALLRPYARLCEADLSRWLVEPGTPDTLATAMRYCTTGGKRLRPALVYLSAEAAGAGGPEEITRRAAAAVEMVHCYSLVHDDLPAMDDDSLRRGRPTAHVQFGQAMAILVGDALLTRAFAVLAEADDPRSAALAAELAWGAGSAGMISGQVADMDLCPLPAGGDALRYIHSRKTAALLRACTRMGPICANAPGEIIDALAAFGEHLGLAFQLMDDLLDVVGEAETIGKTPGKDAPAGKRTHVGRLGAEEARALGRKITGQAIASLRPVKGGGEKLAHLAGLLANRTR